MTACPTCGRFDDRHDLAAHIDAGEDVRVTYAVGGYVDADDLPTIEHPAPFVIPRHWLVKPCDCEDQS